MRNTLHGAGGRVASLFVWFLLTPSILRALGPDAFGIWSLFFALTGNLAALDLGLAQGTLKFVAAAGPRGAHAEAAAHATLAVGGYLILGVIWGLALILGADAILAWFRIPEVLHAGAGAALLAAPLVFVLSGLTNVCMSVSQGYGRFDLANRALLTAVSVQAAGLIGVLLVGPSLQGLVVAVGFGWAAGAGVGLHAVRRAAPDFRWQEPGVATARWAAAVRFGGPMQLTNVLAALHQHVDKVMLGRWISIAAIAPYEIGSRAAVAAATLPQLLLVAVLPEASALHQRRDWARLRELYVRGSRFLLTLASVITAAVLGSSARVIEVWIGEPVEGAVLALRLLTVSAGIALLTGVATSIARGMGRTDLETWFAFVAVGVHVVFAVWLVPARGLEGALLATVAGSFVGAAVFFALFSRVVDGISARDLLQPLMTPIFATAIGSGAGLGIESMLPSASGFLAWAGLGLVALIGAGAALGVCAGTGYFPWRQARSLLDLRVS